ncbi:DUF2130 domain-containing protein [Bradyrhizobium sp. ARR65]|uniref:DUF2130 domain-containing protein n=1 Tax=Bradyrhizobium sp. ARR65 TaxID=1040989 RepID=UPI000466A69E
MANRGDGGGRDTLGAQNTKNWSDAWLQKLRDDERAATADVALIISRQRTLVSSPRLINSINI